MNTGMNTGMNRTTGLLIGRRQHIEQSMTDILTTSLGSRVMRREYGSLLPDLLGKPIDDALVCKLFAASYIALSLYEPRVRINHVAAERQETDGALALLISWVDVAESPETKQLFTFNWGVGQ